MFQSLFSLKRISKEFLSPINTSTPNIDGETLTNIYTVGQETNILNPPAVDIYILFNPNPIQSRRIEIFSKFTEVASAKNINEKFQYQKEEETMLDEEQIYRPPSHRTEISIADELISFADALERYLYNEFWSLEDRQPQQPPDKKISRIPFPVDLLRDAINMLSSTCYDGLPVIVEEEQTIAINDEVSNKIINKIESGLQINKLERIIMDVGILTAGGYQIDGKVNSASDFNENSFEKTEENQKRIAIANVFGTSMDPLLTDNSEVPIIEMPEGTTYEIGDIIVFKSGGFNIIHRVEYVFTYNGETYYVTEGINNKFVDDAVISGDQIVGKADFSKETFEATQELAKQNKLRRYTVHALTENQKNIKSNLENEVSDLLNVGVEIHKIAYEIYSEPNPDNNLIKKILKDPKTGKTKLSKLRNLMLTIDGISDIEGISEDKLELIKQDLLDICFSKLMKSKEKMTYNDIKKLNLPPNFDVRLNNYKNYFVYYHEFEKVFIDAYKNGERLYQSKWLAPGATKGQRKILCQLSGGKDFLTGENFIDLYRQKMIREGKENQLVGKSDEQLLEAAMEFTIRHHFKTDLDHITRTTDSRVSAIVLIWEDTHKDIDNQMDNDDSLNVYFANQFKEIYNQLLQGEAPSTWGDIYQHEFNNNNNDYKNIVGIKFLFYQEYL